MLKLTEAYTWLWLSRVKYRICAAFVWFELECTGWRSAWELPAHQISASNFNSFDLNLRQTPKTKMLSRVKIPKITAMTFFFKDHLWVSCLCVVLFCRKFFFYIFLCLEFFRFYFGENLFQCFSPSRKSECWAGLTSKRFISSPSPKIIIYLTQLSHNCMTKTRKEFPENTMTNCHPYATIWQIWFWANDTFSVQVFLPVDIGLIASLLRKCGAWLAVQNAQLFKMLLRLFSQAIRIAWT